MSQSEGRAARRAATAVTRIFTVPAARYPPDPRALFVLSLCVAVGVPLIFANATPGTIASKLDPPLIVVWGLMLSAGSLVTLLGVLRQSVGGIITEQVGSVAVGGACMIYAVAIWLSVRWAGAVPMVIVFGWGLSCFWRWYQLQRLMKKAEEVAWAVRIDDAQHEQDQTVEDLRAQLKDEDES